MVFGNERISVKLNFERQPVAVHLDVPLAAMEATESTPTPKRHLKSLSLHAHNAASVASPTLAKNRKRLSLQSDPSAAGTPTRSSTPLSSRSPASADSPSRRSQTVSPVKSLSYCSNDDASTAKLDDLDHASKGTLLEQHSDLLSVIAKKERRSLELREELQRNEDELRQLRSRWQRVVSRNASASPNLVGPAKDDALPTPDSPPLTTAPPPPESQDAPSAKRWVNSWVKSGVAGITGMMIPPSAPETTSLGTVREEEEQDSSSQSESADSRRTSSTSTLPSSVTDSPLPTLWPRNDLRSSSPVMEASGSKSQMDTSHAKRGTLGVIESWGKRLTDLQNSDSVKTSKRAVLSFVDSWEKALEAAIVLPETNAATPATLPPDRPARHLTTLPNNQTNPPDPEVAPPGAAASQASQAKHPIRGQSWGGQTY